MIILSKNLSALIVANIIAVCLMLIQIIDVTWGRNTKFAMVSFAVVSVVVSIYNIQIYPYEDRRIMSYGLSAISLSILSIGGTLLLH
jgi:RsiW-degrading membrane proteinase PrsW (M82 family)